MLINQCPHNLDLIQWITGLRPTRVTAVASIGKTHPIEVEDEVSAISNIPAADRPLRHHHRRSPRHQPSGNLHRSGKLIAEKGNWFSIDGSERPFGARDQPRTLRADSDNRKRDRASPGSSEGHQTITQNFVNAILQGEPLIAPGEDGADALELGNAMQMAGLTRTAVEFPLDADAFDRFIADMTARYGGKKTLKTVEGGPADMSSSFRARER